MTRRSPARFGGGSRRPGGLLRRSFSSRSTRVRNSGIPLPPLPFGGPISGPHDTVLQPVRHKFTICRPLKNVVTNAFSNDEVDRNIDRSQPGGQRLRLAKWDVKVFL